MIVALLSSQMSVGSCGNPSSAIKDCRDFTSQTIEHRTTYSIPELRVLFRYCMALFAAEISLVFGLARCRLRTETAKAMSYRTAVAQNPIDPIRLRYVDFISSLTPWGG